MSVIAAQTSAALHRLGVRLSGYDRVLVQACEDVKPLFGRRVYGETYRLAAADPNWMAISLVTNAASEGGGATRLWSLAACTTDADLSKLIKRHAIDESMHARAYVALLDLAFPGALAPELRPDVLALSPGFSERHEPVELQGSPFAHEARIDELIQMNIAEIRTRIHHLLQRPMLTAHCPPAQRAKLGRILDRLLEDETRHILYTAELIDVHWRANPDAVEALFRRRLADFHEITDGELAIRTFD